MVPSLFGRPVNLYWDGQQIPRFLWVTARDQPGWVSAAAAVGVLLLLAALFALLRWALARVARDAAPYALRARWTWLPTGLATVAVVGAPGGLRRPASPGISSPSRSRPPTRARPCC